MWILRQITSGHQKLLEDLRILLGERLPQDCPWHIEVSGDWGNYSEATIVFRQWAKAFDLGTLCPWEQFVWCKYELPSYTTIFKTIKFKIWDIKSKYFLPILLHEIGHSHSKNKQQKLNRDWENIIKRIQRAPTAEWAEFQEDDLNLRKPSRGETYLEERDAWSYALRTIKKLEKKWFHISQWCTLKEIQLFMEMSLFTYELTQDRVWEFPPIIKRVKGKIFRTIYGEQ